MIGLMTYEETNHDLAESGTSGQPWKLLALLIVVAALAAFFFQNGQDSVVHFLWLDGSWPFWKKKIAEMTTTTSRSTSRSDGS